MGRGGGTGIADDTRLADSCPSKPREVLCKTSVAAETSVFLMESPVCQDIPVCVILATESHWISPAQDENILPGKGIRQQRGVGRRSETYCWRGRGNLEAAEAHGLGSFTNTPCPQQQLAVMEIHAVPRDHF